MLNPCKLACDIADNIVDDDDLAAFCGVVAYQRYRVTCQMASFTYVTAGPISAIGRAYSDLRLRGEFSDAQMVSSDTMALFCGGEPMEVTKL